MNRRIQRKTALVMIALTLAFSQLVSGVRAEDTKNLAAKVKKASLSNKFFDFIKPFRKIRGKRQHVAKWWPGADAPAVEFSANGEARWIHENRVISQKIKGNWLGENFEATVLFGYDNTLGEYTCLWSDTLSNRTVFFTGKRDEEGKTITFTAQTGDALSRQPVQIRCVMHLPDRKGEMKTEFYRTDTGGTEYKFMEVVSKRRVSRAA